MKSALEYAASGNWQLLASKPALRVEFVKEIQADAMREMAQRLSALLPLRKSSAETVECATKIDGIVE